MRLKLLPLLGGLCIAFLLVGKAEASTQTKNAQIVTVTPSTAPLCVSVSTSAWTAWPGVATDNLTGRDSVWLQIQSTTTANMIILLAPNATRYTTPTTTAYDFLLLKGNPAATLAIADNLRIWLKSQNTSADTVCGREFIQH